MQLIRETIVAQFMPPSMTAYNYGSGPHKIEIPQSSVSIAKPVTLCFCRFGCQLSLFGV